MNNFELLQKSNVFFGAGEEKKIGKLVRMYSDKCLIIEPDGKPFEDLLERIKKYLGNEGVEVFELGGVVPNPLVSTANVGIELVKKYDIGFILAVGGGSVMDTAKYISYASRWPGENPLDLEMTTEIKRFVIPHGAIVTLSGTGSELSLCSVIVDDLRSPAEKHILFNDGLFFDFSIINPELTYTLPLKHLAAGVTDGISHALEAYVGSDHEEMIFEGYYESIMNTLLKYGPQAMSDPTDYTIRSKISHATMIANHHNFCTEGVQQDWTCHDIERYITTAYHGVHGITLGILMPAFMKYVFSRNPRPFVNFSVRCLGVNPEGKNNAAIVKEGADNFERWLNKMHLPVKFTDIGLTYPQLISCIPENLTAGMLYQLKGDEIKELLSLCV